MIFPWFIRGKGISRSEIHCSDFSRPTLAVLWPSCYSTTWLLSYRVSDLEQIVMFIQTYRFIAAVQDLALTTIMSAALHLFSKHFHLPQQHLHLSSERRCSQVYGTCDTDSIQTAHREHSSERHLREPTSDLTSSTPKPRGREKRPRSEPELGHQRRRRPCRVCDQCKKKKIGCVNKTEEGQACGGAYPLTCLYQTVRICRR